MKNKNLLIVIAVVIFGVAAVFALATRKAGLPAEPSESESNQPASLEFTIEPTTESATQAVTIQPATSPEETVTIFMDNFLKTAPMIDEPGAKEKALALFTEGGRDLMLQANDEPHLGLWLGVQDFPDEGYEIGATTFKDNPATGEAGSLAEVEVSLKYSGGDTIRIFLLAKIGNNWLIDGVNQ